MDKNEKIYDKNGTLLKVGDVIDTDGSTLEIYYDEWYVDPHSKNTIWRIEEFSLSTYKDGILLDDFEKVAN